MHAASNVNDHLLNAENCNICNLIHYHHLFHRQYRWDHSFVCEKSSILVLMGDLQGRIHVSPFNPLRY
jgi:hypothetical protein